VNILVAVVLSYFVTGKVLYEGDTPPPHRGGGGVDGTQYAMGPYAVRRNSVIPYADIIF